MTIETLAHLFYEKTLPRAQWNHRAHLGVALWSVHEFGLDCALEKLRRGIWDYNDRAGFGNGPFGGYHETITQFYARAVAAFLRENPVRNLDESWDELLLKWGDKERIFAYYSRRYLFSPAARSNWLAPDRQPLDF